MIDAVETVEVLVVDVDALHSVAVVVMVAVVMCERVLMASALSDIERYSPV